MEQKLDTVEEGLMAAMNLLDEVCKMGNWTLSDARFARSKLESAQAALKGVRDGD